MQLHYKKDKSQPEADPIGTCYAEA